MKQHGGGFVISASNLNASVEFYCKVMELHVIASDGTSAMLGPEDSQASQLLALRQAFRGHLRAGSGAVGIRALFFRVDKGALNGLEQRLRSLDAFHERHDGEFYEMVSAFDPDRTAIGFWATEPDAPVQGPSFVPPSVYFLD
jgi:catechol 2,3-dioxygenase-like lactoylglutathione lyase family enzyme